MTRCQADSFARRSITTFAHAHWGRWRKPLAARCTARHLATGSTASWRAVLRVKNGFSRMQVNLPSTRGPLCALARQNRAHLSKPQRAARRSACRNRSVQAGTCGFRAQRTTLRRNRFALAVASAPPPAACRVLPVEAKSGLREDRFSPDYRRVAPLPAKIRRKSAPRADGCAARAR